MSVEQLIYTSCKTGINNQGSGFQVYSHSAGLNQFQVADIQRHLCHYKEPHNLPGTPTLEEIDALFPVAFSYKKLDQENCCVCQSVYVGRDYTGESGRFGNYLSHVYCMSKQELNFYPVELYCSPLFVRRLNESKMNSNAVPEPLGQVDISRLNAGLNRGVSLEGVAEFISGERVEYFKLMLGAVIEAEKTSKRMIICDTNENIIMWIAALMMAFPVSSAMNLTFNTYVFDPDHSDEFICGVASEGTVYSAQNALTSGLYYLFDFISNVYSPVESDSSFIDLVEVAYEFSPDSLNNFHSFLGEIKYLSIGEKIEAAYRLYTIIHGGYADLEETEITAAFNFALDHCEPDVLGQVYRVIKENADMFIEHSTFSTAPVINKFLLDCSERLQSREVRQFSYHFFYAVLQKFVFDYGKSAEGEIDAYSDMVTSIYGTSRKQLTNYILSDEMTMEISLGLEGDPVVYHNAFFGRRVIESIMENGTGLDEFLNSGGAGILTRILSNIALMKNNDMVNCSLELLKSFQKDWSNSLKMLAVICETVQPHQEVEEKIFVECNQLLTQSTQNSYIYQLNSYAIKRGMPQLAFQLYAGSLVKSPDPREFFWSYFTAVVSTNHKYRENYLDQIVREYLNAVTGIGESEYFSELGSILKRLLDLFTSEDFIRELLTSYNSNLNLARPVQQLAAVVTKIYHYKEEKGIKTVPDRVKLLYFEACLVEAVRNGIIDVINDSCAKFKDLNFNGIDDGELRQYFMRLLQRVSAVGDPKVHTAVSRACFEAPQDLFYDCFLEAVLQEYKKNKTEKILLGFLAHIVEVSTGGSIIDEVSGKIYGKITDAVYRINQHRLEKLSKAILRYDQKTRSTWRSILDEVQERRDSSVMGRVKNIFKKE